jgi:tetratricopeptide (TPR) repeat protein
MSLAGHAPADQSDKRLDAIFERLKTTESGEEAAVLTTMVWAIWIESDNEAVSAFMTEGIKEMSRQNFDEAAAAFTKVIEADPDFAEGWNKRATVYYLMGKYSESIRDVERTLALEPRHFGALSGLGVIYLALGDGWAALKAFEAALKVNPHLTSARIYVEELRKYLRGKRI